MSKLDTIATKLSQWADEDTGIVKETAAHKLGNWRPAEVVSITPPQVNILGIGVTNIRFRNTTLSTVQVGDIVMMQQIGPVWVAVYEVEAI